jgi:hypothetical protein
MKNKAIAIVVIILVTTAAATISILKYYENQLNNKIENHNSELRKIFYNNFINQTDFSKVELNSNYIQLPSSGQIEFDDKTVIQYAIRTSHETEWLKVGNWIYSISKNAGAFDLIYLRDNNGKLYISNHHVCTPIQVKGKLKSASEFLSLLEAK